jgi:hypothetical protein
MNLRIFVKASEFPDQLSDFHVIKNSVSRPMIWKPRSLTNANLPIPRYTFQRPSRAHKSNHYCPLLRVLYTSNCRTQQNLFSGPVTVTKAIFSINTFSVSCKSTHISLKVSSSPLEWTLCSICAIFIIEYYMEWWTMKTLHFSWRNKK